MTKIRVLLSLLVVLTMFVTGCASAPEQKESKESFTQMDDLFAQLYVKQMEMTQSGAVVAVGIGVDKNGRFDRALEKAMLAGRAEVARNFEIKVQALQKSFYEEIGSDVDSQEINETFESVTKTVANKTLAGSTALTTPIRKDKENGEVEVAVLVGIDPATINNSIMDEVKTKNINLYERFRSSEAFKELEAEIEKFEASK